MLDYRTKYPGQVSTGDAGYPYGKARNVTVEGDGTGTPWEEALVNDLLGFVQELIIEAALTPNGSSDSISNDQLLQALKIIIAATEEFTGDVEIDGALTIDGQSIHQGASYFNAFTQFNQQTNFIGITGYLAAATFYGGITVTDVVQHGTVLSDAIVYQSDEIILTGEGRIRSRTVYGTDTNSSYGVESADVVVAKSTVLSAARDYTILDAGASEGSKIEFRNWSGYTITIKNEGGTTLGTLAPVSAGGPPTQRPGITRLVWENDGLGARWMVTEEIVP